MRSFVNTMKASLKIFSVFLASFYLVLSFGFGIRAHYCHGDLSSITYVGISHDCSCGDQEIEMSCCSNVEEFVQFDEELVLNQFKNISIDADLPFNEYDDLTEEKDVARNFDYQIKDFNSESPPLYIQNVSLILYA